MFPDLDTTLQDTTLPERIALVVCPRLPLAPATDLQPRTRSSETHSAAAPFFASKVQESSACGSRRCSRIHSYHSHLAFVERFAILWSPLKIIEESGFCFWETRRFAAYTWRFISTS